MRFAELLLVTTIFLGGGSVFAHGEDVPGPHGGEVRMPGAYHTEVILLDSQRLKIYLLDMNWKNPTVENSKVDVVIRGKVNSKAVCEKEGNAFSCSFGEDVNLKSRGAFEVQSTRDGVKGGAAKYSTPLKFGGK